MTHITLTSNTQVTIPNSALFPGEGVYYPLLISNTAQELFRTLTDSGREGIFVNPQQANIANTANVANVLISRIAMSNNHLSNDDKSNLLSIINSTNAMVMFIGTPPANTSVIEARYTTRGNVAILDSFVANGSQSVFSLSAEPQLDQIPMVHVNYVYQSNSAFNFIAGEYGVLGGLIRLKAHTDRLSGITTTEFTDETDLNRIASIGIALNTLANGIDGDAVYSSNNVMYCVSALFCEDVLQAYRDTINNDILVSLSGNTTNVARVTTQLWTMANGISNIIDSDIGYYRQVEAYVKYSTLSAFVQTIYGEPSGNYLLKYLIGTDELKTILE